MNSNRLGTIIVAVLGLVVVGGTVALVFTTGGDEENVSIEPVAPTQQPPVAGDSGEVIDVQSIDNSAGGSGVGGSTGDGSGSSATGGSRATGSVTTRGVNADGGGGGTGQAGGAVTGFRDGTGGDGASDQEAIPGDVNSPVFEVTPKDRWVEETLVGQLALSEEQVTEQFPEEKEKFEALWEQHIEELEHMQWERQRAFEQAHKRGITEDESLRLAEEWTRRMAPVQVPVLQEKLRILNSMRERLEGEQRDRVNRALRRTNQLYRQYKVHLQ